MAYVRTRLGRWFYEERGPADGPAVVLAHGLLFDRTMWAGQIEPLIALGARVLFADNPGHGQSEVPPPFSLDDHARAFVDALDGWKVEKAAIVGLSWGGMLGMRVAIAVPNRVTSLVLADTTAGEEPRVNRVKYRALASFEKHLGLPEIMAKKSIAPLLFSKATLTRDPATFDRWYRRVVGYPRLGLYRAAKAVVIERPTIVPKLGEIQAPTLVLCGQDDVAQPIEESRNIANGIPNATLKVVEGCGHMSALENPTAFNREMVPFVKEHLAR
ncbi:MAG TPA: alpha/beta fold hydrolase [Polyangiaceae bacterium]